VKPGQRPNWSIGDSADTDVVGRAVVASIDGETEFLGCGVIIARAPDQR
jgi:hypothetical protein